MVRSIQVLINYSWMTVGIIWLLTAIGTKRAVKRYSGSARIIQFALVFFAFLFVFYRSLPMASLDTRVVPRSLAASVTGAAITLAGLLFALWARFFLGRNWSGEITVKQDHQLIRRGPYAIVRHPIYAGFLFALLGTAIAFGQVRSFIGLGLATIGWRLKSLVEEQYMTDQFGAEYAAYKSRVKALLPFIW
jgi:protein-S-isoprenylcysteine O-methyltransferase Ste14